jgi:hypothetical protein
MDGVVHAWAELQQEYHDGSGRQRAEELGQVPEVEGGPDRISLSVDVIGDACSDDELRE